MAVDDEFSMTDEPSQAGLRRFSAEELVACEKCGRANGPTRMNCLYCGAALPATERSAALRRPVLRKLEEWERGFNVVLPPQGARELSPEAAEEAASLLRLEAERLRECLSSGRALPLARAASAEEAELVVGRLASLGVAAESVPDEALGAQEPPKRVRALLLAEDALVGWAGADSEPHSIAWPDVLILVAGRVVQKRVETEERRGVVKAKNRVVDTRELVAAEDAVLDIFSSGEADGAGWRIAANNFDYSCLGEGKGLLARDNFVTLVRVLRERAARAAFDDEYARVRHLLAVVWPLATRKETSGLKRQGLGRFNTEATTVVSNEEQFTRYARLRRLYALREREGG